MKRTIKSYKDFIFEVRDKAIKHAGDDIDNSKNDEELEKEVETYMNKKTEYCPRCEEDMKRCKCSDEDYWSTQTYHRTPN